MGGQLRAPARSKQPNAPPCAICGRTATDFIAFGNIRPALAEGLLAASPHLKSGDAVCRQHLTEERTRYVQRLLERERGEISELERQVVESLAREETIARDTEAAWAGRRTRSERLADFMADAGGSWPFILGFLLAILLWTAFNVRGSAASVFDPYPFILLNLVLSCVAALQAPIIMMSQKRQEAKDRLRSENDYRINLKAELEIRHIHEKLDHMIGRQWERLAEIQQIQLEILEDTSNRNR